MDRCHGKPLIWLEIWSEKLSIDRFQNQPENTPLTNIRQMQGVPVSESKNIPHRRFLENGGWNLQGTLNPDGTMTAEADRIQCAYLIGIYEELRKLNCLLGCQNFMDIPKHLKKISRNTTRKKKVAKLRAA